MLAPKGQPGLPLLPRVISRTRVISAAAPGVVELYCEVGERPVCAAMHAAANKETPISKHTLSSL